MEGLHPLERPAVREGLGRGRVTRQEAVLEGGEAGGKLRGRGSLPLGRTRV
ncbi:hypothetical protein STAFG_8593 [Streptomyces afghaniensis 772]|uniref:Uncharacterized protein n=1 Tax=Streptomyces afghaniensis 772 TaxID=1283301 RepID=S4MFQ0_9ACTN|nr:hypothetical protein STAFG_8593 [Streptomyces afghaniensis 772]